MLWRTLTLLLFISQHPLPGGADDADYDEEIEQKFRLDIIGRPDTIYPPLQNYNKKLTHQGFGANNSVAVSRHHIIPMNHLLKFYNKLIKKPETSKMRSFWDKFFQKFRQFYERKGTEEGNVKKYEKVIVNVLNLVEDLMEGRVMHDPTARRPNNFDEFQEYYAWLPGNLFIGPNRRSDDPHDGFEINSKTVVGSRRFENLKNVYDWMQLYIATY